MSYLKRVFFWDRQNGNVIHRFEVKYAKNVILEYTYDTNPQKAF